MNKKFHVVGLFCLLGIVVSFSFVLPVAGDNCSDPACWGECVNRACAKCETVCAMKDSQCFLLESWTSECEGPMCCTDFYFQCENGTPGHHFCCSFSVCCRK